MDCSALQRSLVEVKKLYAQFETARREAIASGKFEIAKQYAARLERELSELEDTIDPFEPMGFRAQYHRQKKLRKSLSLPKEFATKYHFPSYKNILSRLKEKKEIVMQKEAQGFTKLLIVPVGLTIAQLLSIYDARLRVHYDRSNLFLPRRDLSKQRATAYYGNNSYLHDEFPDEDDIVYYPTVFDRDRARCGGVTKKELLKRTIDAGTPGYEILLVEEPHVIPKEGEEKTVGDRPQLTTGHSIAEYLEKLNSSEPNSPYRHESGLTPEAWLALALCVLEENNETLDNFKAGATHAFLGTWVPYKFSMPSGAWSNGMRIFLDSLSEVDGERTVRTGVRI